MFKDYYEVIERSDGTKEIVSNTNLPTPSEIRNMWCFGLPLTKEDGEPMPDEYILKFLYSAIAETEKNLGVYLKPTKIVSRPHERGLVQGVDYEVEEPAYDYSAYMYRQYGFLQLRRRPIISVDGLKLVLPNGQIIMDFFHNENVRQWVKEYKKGGQIHLVPYAGDPTLFALLGGSQSGYPFATGRINSNLPQMFYVDYTAGFDWYQIPNDVRNIVAKLCAIDVLGVAGDAVMVGISSISTSIDGISESTSLTASATSATYGAHIKQLQDEVKEYFEKGNARSKHRGITMTGL